MYERYSDFVKWKVETISSTPSQLGGVKEIILSISGENVFSKLKYESGVHRVQKYLKQRVGEKYIHLQLRLLYYQRLKKLTLKFQK